MAELPQCHGRATRTGEDMIIDMQRRLTECGRIRIGKQVSTSNGKSRPVKLDTFRLTSADRVRIENAAKLYGGTPTEWEAPAGPQWEVITTSDAIDVVVPPSVMAFSQWYETWSAGGCRRRCDGVTESIGEQPCLCDPDNRECDIHSRLSVMLRDLPGLGVWRVDTSGWYAAQELLAAVEVIHLAAGRGAMLPARLRLEQRVVKRDVDGSPQTRRFAVPVLDIDSSPAELLAEQRYARAITAGEARDGRGFVPVPEQIGGGPSIAEQSAAPAPAPAPARTRSNAAQPIPGSGRRRNNANAAAVPTSSDSVSTEQLRELVRRFTGGGVTDRSAMLSATTAFVGREIASANDLTMNEAAGLLVQLDEWAQQGDLAEQVAALMATEDAWATTTEAPTDRPGIASSQMATPQQKRALATLIAKAGITGSNARHLAAARLGGVGNVLLSFDELTFTQASAALDKLVAADKAGTLSDLVDGVVPGEGDPVWAEIDAAKTATEAASSQ
jgi:Recombination directionality factor-like